MTFEWDEAKNQANVRKHGVDFKTAKRIFEGLVVTRVDQRKDYGEDRYITIGRGRARGARGCPYPSGEPHPFDLGSSGVP